MPNMTRALNRDMNMRAGAAEGRFRSLAPHSLRGAWPACGAGGIAGGWAVGVASRVETQAVSWNTPIACSEFDYCKILSAGFQTPTGAAQSTARRTRIQ